MNSDVLKDTFYALVAPDLPNEWDVDEALEPLAKIDDGECRSVLDQVPIIWPVSHSLCFDYLKMAAPALHCLETERLPEWVNSTLDEYEKDGLRAAQRYMADVEKNFVCRIEDNKSVRYEQVTGKLLPYLRGLSGRPLELSCSETIATDTTTVFVPPEINLFADQADNFFFYKLIITYQWAYIALSSFTYTPQDENRQGSGSDFEELWLQKALQEFAQPGLAGDLYHFLETLRADLFLAEELPGLMRRKRELLHSVSDLQLLYKSDGTMLSRLQERFLLGSAADDVPGNLLPMQEEIDRFCREAGSPADTLETVQLLHDLILAMEPGYTATEPMLFQGYMRLDAVEKARGDRLKELEELFVEGLATRILSFDSGEASDKDQEDETFSGDSTGQSDMALVIDKVKESTSGQSDRTLVATLNNEEMDLGEELADIANRIIDELGAVPDRYIASAAGRAGQGHALFASGDPGQGSELIEPIMYDEWDYRRNDFRKNWCSTLEKQIPLTRSTFYQTTLEKYHGQIVRLRYQFEMMRTKERFVRRQRDGEDIDLDALVESLADTRAGLPPSDRLFVRLKRDERDIAVLFLIDMSNSTEGWVGQVIRESLVLLCEALEVVGDRYAIYGFSGMRRLRNDYFHIKHIDEPYDDQVKVRIESIAPREYTRMGPAIRHSISILREVDSRVRLLITLTDGKPEDYDDYKGEYAVEDTRHALVEARAAGIHPFCITIDRSAHEYMEHMFGEKNYIMIDDVKKLPRKMPEIYRVLTV